MLAATRWSVGNSYADGKLSDLELIDIYRKGDSDALAELYRRYDAPEKDGKIGGVVGLIARKYPTISDEEKEDLHQEVWMRIIHDLDGDVDFSKFSWSTYIFNVLRWVSSKYYKGEDGRPFPILDAPVGEGAETKIGDMRTTADGVWASDGKRRETRKVLDQLFEILAPDEAAVMNMIADGKTAKEIAKELGLHEYDVKNIKSRVIAALKKRTAAEEPQARQVPQASRFSGPVLPNVGSLGHAGTLGTVSAASDTTQYSGEDE